MPQPEQVLKKQIVNAVSFCHGNSLILWLSPLQRYRISRIEWALGFTNSTQCFLQLQSQRERSKERKIRCVSQKSNSFSFSYDRINKIVSSATFKYLPQVTYKRGWLVQQGLNLCGLLSYQSYLKLWVPLPYIIYIHFKKSCIISGKDSNFS